VKDSQLFSKECILWNMLNYTIKLHVEEMTFTEEMFLLRIITCVCSWLIRDVHRKTCLLIIRWKGIITTTKDNEMKQLFAACKIP
jgi:hypothetical protein